MIQICSRIISGRVLNGELYVQRLQKLIYLHLLNRLFNEDFSSILGAKIKQKYTCTMLCSPED